MLSVNPPLLARYGAAGMAVVLALLLTWLLQPFLSRTVMALFFAAVMLSAWYGGPGLLATGLSVGAIDVFFLSPTGGFRFDLPSVLQLGVFVFVAFVISFLTSARKRAEEALRQAYADLERRVQERTRQLATVFELFATTKAPGKGTGLGLGICQEIVKAHGGSIALTSQEGQGTYVQVLLPLQETGPPGLPEETG